MADVLSQPVDAIQFDGRVHLAVCKDLHDVLGNGLLLFRCDGRFVVGYTYITLHTVVALLFSEIQEQLFAAADVIIGDIVDDGLHAFHEFLFAMFIDFGSENQSLHFLPSLGIGDVRYFLLRDKLQYSSFVEFLENVIYLR